MTNATNAYAELAKRLEGKGIGSYFQNSEMLVVSNQNPAMPDSNTFWVTNRGGQWYLSTWMPAVYQVPKDRDVVEICEIVFRSSEKALYTIDAPIALDLNLRLLSDDEATELGLD
jgi:hypothetical protein